MGVSLTLAAALVFVAGAAALAWRQNIPTSHLSPLLLPGLPNLPLLQDHVSPAAWSYPVVLIGLVWVVNLNNFMDGIDRIASVEAIFVAAGAAAILRLNGGTTSLIVLLALLGAAVAGFLVRIWLILYGVFAADATCNLVCRFLRREKLFDAHAATPIRSWPAAGSRTEK